MQQPTSSAFASRSDNRRACANCARAKARCVVGDGSNGACQRCCRLQKSCEANPVRARTEPRKRRPLESTRIAKYRVEKLEEKLDDLVSLLKSGQENGNPVLISPPETIAPSRGNTSIDYLQPENQKHIENAADYLQAESWDDRLHNGGTISKRFAIPADEGPFKGIGWKAEDPLPYDFGDIDLGIEDPDVLLAIYRTEMHPNFPYIVIGNSMSASDLRRDRPTLFTAVMAVTTRNSAQQAKLGNQVVQQVADRLLVRGERNLDLLLGILTYASWCVLNFFNPPRLTAMITSATTLIVDMRLNGQGEKCIPTQIINVIRSSCAHELPKEAVKTLEERRAFLGYWFLTSVVSGFFRRLDKPSWLAYNEECCQLLETANAHHDDMTAVRLIRLQLLGDKITSSPWHVKQLSQRPVAPPILYLASLRNELEDLKKCLSFDLEKNDAVLLTYQSIEVLLYKVGLSKSLALDVFQNRDFNRIESLYACQQALKQFFDIYLAVDVSRYHCLSVPMSTLLTWNLGVLQLLSTFEHPDWSPEWARENLNFTGVLDLLYKRYSTAKGILGFDSHTELGEDIFTKTAKKICWMKSFFEERSGGPSVIAESAGAEITEITDLQQASEFVDLLDDEWMQELLGSWEY